MDVTDLDRVRDMMSRYKPVVVIHTAALTDVDGCETAPWDALRINAMGAQNVALACLEVDAAMLYVSTDFVFNGTRGGPYAEWDAADPVNVYGQSKYAGEVAVRDHLRRFFIVRTSGLYGQHGRSFVRSILEQAQQKTELRVVADQVTLPTYTRDLANALYALVRTRYYGTYHITNASPTGIPRDEWARRILAATGMSRVTVVPISSEEAGRAAYRPPHPVLGNTFYHLRGLPPMRSCDEALRAFLQEVGLATAGA